MSLAALHGSQLLEQVPLMNDRLEVTEEFVLRILTPMKQKSLCYFNAISRFSFAIQSCRSITPCSNCGICKYECSLTPCRRCNKEVCRTCSDSNARSYKCAHCDRMVPVFTIDYKEESFRNFASLAWLIFRQESITRKMIDDQG